MEIVSVGLFVHVKRFFAVSACRGFVTWTHDFVYSYEMAVSCRFTCMFCHMSLLVDAAVNQWDNKIVGNSFAWGQNAMTSLASDDPPTNK